MRIDRTVTDTGKRADTAFQKKWIAKWRKYNRIMKFEKLMGIEDKHIYSNLKEWESKEPV